MNDATRSAWSEAYEATTYRVAEASGSIDIRVGHRHPRIDALLTILSVTDWAFVSAWNPGSTRAPPAHNVAANHELERTVRDRGYRFHEGAGIPDRAGWAPEPSLWIAGIDRTKAAALGRSFGQKAIVVGSLGAPAELLFCD